MAAIFPKNTQELIQTKAQQTQIRKEKSQTKTIYTIQLYMQPALICVYFTLSVRGQVFLKMKNEPKNLRTCKQNKSERRKTNKQTDEERSSSLHEE